MSPSSSARTSHLQLAGVLQDSQRSPLEVTFGQERCLRSEHEMRAAGTWAEARQALTDTICPYCGVGCTLTLHVQDGEIVKVTSPLDHEVADGHLCIKGRFGWAFVGSGTGTRPRLEDEGDPPTAGRGSVRRVPIQVPVEG